MELKDFGMKNIKMKGGEMESKMRKVIYLLTALMALMISNAVAGDYHSGTTLACQECHVMHYSQTHGYNANGSGITVDMGTDGPYHYLLRNHINDLCLTCHDNQSFAPDVLAENGGSLPTNGRQAGALNRDNVAPYFDATGHTLGSTDVAPGGTWSNPDGLSCINCHTQHGRGNPAPPGGVSTSAYRNLAFNVTGTNIAGVSYAVGTNDLTRDVFERSANYGGDHYDIQNVDFNEPNPTASAYGEFCKQCHTNFHGSSSDANMRNTAGTAGQEWYRHPTADANIGAQGGGHSSISRAFGARAYRVQVMSPTGNWGTWGTAMGASTPTDLTPSCMSCHKAHGNTRAFGLIWATGAANYGENGDGTNYKALCGQCHVQVTL